MRLRKEIARLSARVEKLVAEVEEKRTRRAANVRLRAELAAVNRENEKFRAEGERLRKRLEAVRTRQ